MLLKWKFVGDPKSILKSPRFSSPKILGPAHQDIYNNPLITSPRISIHQPSTPHSFIRTKARQMERGITCNQIRLVQRSEGWSHDNSRRASSLSSFIPSSNPKQTYQTHSRIIQQFENGSDDFEKDTRRRVIGGPFPISLSAGDFGTMGPKMKLSRTGGDHVLFYPHFNSRGWWVSFLQG